MTKDTSIASEIEILLSTDIGDIGNRPRSDIKEVLIYGYGGFGQWVARTLESLSISVRGFIDNNLELQTTGAAMSLAHSRELLAHVTVVVGVFSPGPDCNEIVNSLRSAGCASVMTPPELFMFLSQRRVSANRYWLSTDFGLYREDKTSIVSTLNLLSDSESHRNYLNLLRYRLRGDAHDSPQPRPLSEQHTGSDFGFLTNVIDATIDCGAFDGDTLDNWATTSLEPSQILCLEPDSQNFSKLVTKARESQFRVLPLPLGVVEKTGRFRVVGSGPSARLEEDVDGTVSALSLDDLLIRTRAGLIKMDIEGGEAAALRGAKEVLIRDRPHLAISVYHKPWHLWRIASWIDLTLTNYDLRLRVYGHQGYDAVLYARASEKL